MTEKNTIVAQGSVFEGKFTVQGSVIIEGSLKGEIQAEQKVIIGKTGKVDAEVSAAQMEVSGEFKGNVKAEKEIIINATGKLKGNIIHRPKNLIINRGGLFIGKSLELTRPEPETHLGPLRSTA